MVVISRDDRTIGIYALVVWDVMGHNKDMTNEPLFPTNTNQVYATEVRGATASHKTRKRLSNVTWTLGDKPCKTLVKATGCWTDVTRS